MAKPSRNSDPSAILSSSRTFFVTTKTISGCALLQTERNAGLLIDVMRSYVAAGQFTIHDFAVMPNHVHRLMTIKGNMSIEKAAGMIKGNFSFRLKKEFGYLGEIWQRGFSTVTARVNACPDTKPVESIFKRYGLAKDAKPPGMIGDRSLRDTGAPATKVAAAKARNR